MERPERKGAGKMGVTEVPDSKDAGKMDMQHFDADYDVVVAGFGFAGAAAALAAHDAGARVLVVEKMPDPGGISICAGGGVRVVLEREGGRAYLRQSVGEDVPGPQCPGHSRSA